MVVFNWLVGFAALWNLGLAYKRVDDVEKATHILRECLPIREKAFPATHRKVIDGK